MKNKNKLVTVIIPVFNSEKYLKRLFSSLINQTYKNLEIVVIDDGSTDGSRFVIEKYCKSEERIVSYYSDNKGVSEARNFGIKVSNGDYICFIDADDFVEPRYIEELISGVSENQAQLAICNYTLIFNGTKKNNRIYPSMKEIAQVDSETIIKEILLSNSYFKGFVWNKIFDSKIIKKHSIRFNSNSYILEDMEFVINYLCIIDNVKLINKPLYNYVQHSNSTTKRIDDNYVTVFKTISNITSILDEEYLPFVRVLYYEFYANIFKYQLKNRELNNFKTLLSRKECIFHYILFKKLKKRNMIQKFKDQITFVLIFFYTR